MPEKRKPLEIFQTPLGVLNYPWISTPDVKYDPTGVFRTQLIIPFDQSQDLIARMEKIRDDEFAKLDTQKSATFTKKDVYEVEFTQPDKDATDAEKAVFVSEPTDNVVFRAKLKKVVTPKEGEPFEQAPIIIDGDEVPITLDVWSGSKAILRGQLVPWTNAAQKEVGVTLRMRAVKVLDLVTGEGSTWGAFD